MKYTRYNLKKNNKKNNSIVFIISICVVLILAFVSGTMISNLFIKKSKGNGKLQQRYSKQNIENNKKASKGDKSITEIDNFIILQCGVFANVSNANVLKQQLNSFGNPFIYEENGKNKVILGMYSTGELDKVTKSLEQGKVEYSKINIKPDLESKANLQIAQIINAQLQILHSFCDDKAKFVQTKQIKEWCSKLDKVNEEEKNYKLLNELKNNVQNLPDKITRDKLEELNKNLYKNIKLLQ
ncbi:SPOR domain-containing protein [Clostridium botulinum]|nr:SPOR domain-containing protein [Clostridium botulinum]